MSKTLRWGVLGTAKFAREHMAPAIHMAAGAELVALATSHPEKAQPFQAFHPGLRIIGEYQSLLADPDIDAIYIPLPNHLHKDWTLKALNAGKHVLCEKPLGFHSSDFDPVIAARDASSLLAAEAFMIVHHPQWHLAKELYQSGEIGDLVLVDAVFSYDNSTDPGNIRNRPETGGGSIPDIGVYTFGGTRFVTDQEPTAVQSGTVRVENEIDTYAEATADFPGFRFRSVTSMRMCPRQEVVFQGTKGIIRLTAPFNPGVFGVAEVVMTQTDGTVRQWTWPRVNQYVRQVEAFCRSVQDGVSYACPLEFSRGTQHMIDMFWQAVKGKQDAAGS